MKKIFLGLLIAFSISAKSQTVLVDTANGLSYVTVSDTIINGDSINEVYVRPVYFVDTGRIIVHYQLRHNGVKYRESILQLTGTDFDSYVADNKYLFRFISSLYNLNLTITE